MGGAARHPLIPAISNALRLIKCRGGNWINGATWGRKLVSRRTISLSEQISALSLHYKFRSLLHFFVRRKRRSYPGLPPRPLLTPITSLGKHNSSLQIILTRCSSIHLSRRLTFRQVNTSARHKSGTRKTELTILLELSVVNQKRRFPHLVIHFTYLSIIPSQ
jgi:hypothetical protein